VYSCRTYILHWGSRLNNNINGEKMATGIPPATVSLLEALDRILDKDVIRDAPPRVSLIGIELLTVGNRALVAFAETYIKYAGRIRKTGLAATLKTT